MISKAPALRDQVYAHIRDQIVSGVYPPGKVLVEVEIASELSVSRTPVSNALVMLRERGLIEDDGGRLHVPVLSLDDVVQLYWCRMAHDGLASRLTASRISPGELATLDSYVQAWETPEQEPDHAALWVTDLNFHRLIYQVAGNTHLLRFSEMTLELASSYQRNTIRRMTGPEPRAGRSREDVRGEHRRIVEAIASRDPDAAEAAARAHIHNVIQHLELADVLL